MEEYLSMKLKELFEFYHKLEEDLEYTEDEEMKRKIEMSIKVIELRYMELEDSIREAHKRCLQILSGK